MTSTVLGFSGRAEVSGAGVGGEEEAKDIKVERSQGGSFGERV